VLSFVDKVESRQQVEVIMLMYDLEADALCKLTHGAIAVVIFGSSCYRDI